MVMVFCIVWRYFWLRPIDDISNIFDNDNPRHNKILYSKLEPFVRTELVFCLKFQERPDWFNDPLV